MPHHQIETPAEGNRGTGQPICLEARDRLDAATDDFNFTAALAKGSRFIYASGSS